MKYAQCPECKAKYFAGETVILDKDRNHCCQECYKEDKFIQLIERK